MAHYPMHNNCGGAEEMLDGLGYTDDSTDQALSTCPFLPPASISSFPMPGVSSVASGFPQRIASTSSLTPSNESLCRDPVRSLHIKRFLRHSLGNAQPEHARSKENHDPWLLDGISSADSGDLHPLGLETSRDSSVRLSHEPGQRGSVHTVTSSAAPFRTLGMPTVTDASGARHHQSYQDMFAAAGGLSDFGDVTALRASGPQAPRSGGGTGSPGVSLGCTQLLELLQNSSATERLVHTSTPPPPCSDRTLPASSNGSRSGSSGGKVGSCWKAGHNMPRPVLLAKNTTKVSAGKGRTSLPLLDKLEKVEGTDWDNIADFQDRDADNYPRTVIGASLRDSHLPLISNCALINSISSGSRRGIVPRPAEAVGSRRNLATAATEMSTNPPQYPAQAQVACMWNPSPACVPPNQAWQASSEPTPAGPNFRFVLNTYGVPAHLLSNSGPSSGPPPSAYLPTAAGAADRTIQIPTSSQQVATQLHTPGSSGSEVGTPNGKSLNLSNAHAMQQQQQQQQFSAPAAITRGNASPVGGGHAEPSVPTDRSSMGMTYASGISSCSGHSSNGFHSEQQLQQQGTSSNWLVDKARPIYQHTQHQPAQHRGMGAVGAMVPVHGRSDASQSPYQHHMHGSLGPCNQSGMRSPQFRSGHSPHAGYDSLRQDHGGAALSMVTSDYAAPTAPHLYGVAPAGGFAPRPLTMQPAGHPGFRSPVLPYQTSSLPVQDRSYSPLINPAAAAAPPQYSPEGRNDPNGEQIFLGQLPGSPLRSRYLWLFLLRLLEDSRYSAFITWTRRRDLEFQLRQPEEVAALWGRVKRRSNMTYDKMSRAMRYYYRQNVLRKVRNKRYVYRFLRIPSLEQQASSLPASAALASVTASDRSPLLPHAAVPAALGGARDIHSDPESNDGDDDDLPLSPLPAKPAIAPAPSAISGVNVLDIAAIIAKPTKAEQSPHSESDVSR